MGQNWRRILIGSSLAFALLLVCASIYLHLKQKNHLGRLRHDDGSGYETRGVVEAARDRAIETEVGDTTTAEEYIVRSSTPNLDSGVSESADEYDEEEDEEEDDEDSDDEDGDGDDDESLEYYTTDDITSKNGLGRRSGRAITVIPSLVCLQCACTFSGSCKLAECTDNGECGDFHVSRDYWSTVQNRNDEGTSGDIQSQYMKCANDFHCVYRTVMEFVRQNARDCNGDGVIDCLDFIAIEKFGRAECYRLWPWLSAQENVPDCLQIYL